MLQALSYSDFAGGAQLQDQSSELDSNMALDLVNVRFGGSGELRRRPGWRVLGFDALGQPPVSMAVSRAGTDPVVLAVNETLMKAFDFGGEQVGAQAVLGGRCSFAHYGAPTQESTFIANGEELIRWDGMVFAVNPAATVNGVAAPGPKPRAVAVTPWDNRLLACGFREESDGPGGGQGSTSSVFASAFGDPSSWTTTHREQLTPGDGEDVVAAVAWRDLVFVFKQTKFFVFTSTTDAGGGRPRFNYYSVQANCGAMHPQGVVAARDGVYFLDRKGVYRTQGEEPELVSWNIEPLFRGQGAPYFTGGRPALASLEQGTLAFAAERLYLAVPGTGGGWVNWCLDPRFSWWAHDTLGMRCGCAGEMGGVEQLFFGRFDGGQPCRFADGIPDDQGEPIEAAWRGAWLSEGSAGEKIVHRLRVWGLGRISLGMAVDFDPPAVGRDVDLVGGGDTWGDGSDAGDAWGDGGDPGDTWGGRAGYVDGWVDYSWKGSVFSMEVRNRDGSDFSVQRVEHHVTPPRRPAHDSRANVAVGS